MFWKKKISKAIGYIRLPNVRRWISDIHKDKKAQVAVEQLIQSSRLKREFFVMCGLSGLLSTLGILLNDTAILIGAMVLAPLLNPVLAFAAGITLLHHRLILYAAKSFFGAVLFVVFVSAIFVKILLLTGHGASIEISVFIQKFRRYDTFLLLAAFISGFSGVYAWLRPTSQLNLIGVAIAVSLIPFVSFFGILLGLGNIEQMGSFLYAFVLNLMLIIVGATLAFMGLGFTRGKSDIEDHAVDHKAN